ncbi:hypothetical protein EUX98_g921 [Antrodiella citrinella]|uniref:non-specific serine/threonine protein kinase n=1 Tax=Antrodiella citrinella TaxID=2447956 RepID=A0A4S4N2T6_9APHY|nr:hypothetical protein EUX98_g921 [Antrodiella citrinella]
MAFSFKLRIFKPKPSNIIHIEPTRRPKSLPASFSPPALLSLIKPSRTEILHTEKELFDVMDEAFHDPGFLNIRPPVGHGALVDWMDQTLRSGTITIKDLSTILGIEHGNCAEVSKAVTSSRTVASQSPERIPLPPPEPTIRVSVSFGKDELVNERYDILVSIDLSNSTPVQSSMLLDHAEGPTTRLSPLPPYVPEDTPDMSRTLVNIVVSNTGSTRIPTYLPSTGDYFYDIRDSCEVTPDPISDTLESCAEYLLPVLSPGAEAVALLRGGDEVFTARADAADVVCHHEQQLAPAAPAPPAIISMRDFTAVKKLGSGAFGVVHMVQYKETGALCAIKVMCKPRWEAGVTALEQREAELHFMKAAVDEQLTFRRCEGAQGVVQLIGSFYDTENFYFLMPLYAGGELHTELIRYGRFSEVRTRVYAAELVQGLVALHERGIIHRDLKPENILIDDKGHLIIADLGLARAFKTYPCDTEKAAYELLTMSAGYGDVNEVTNSYCGTRKYMAPEIYSTSLYSYAVDVWALGTIVYEMLFGHLPWNSVDYDDLEDAITQGGVDFDAAEVVAFGITEDAFLFLKQTMAMAPEYRSSSSSLKHHPFFKRIDWENLRTSQLPASWVPQSDLTFDETPPSLAQGKEIGPHNDFFPWFNYKSPQLSHLTSTVPVAAPDPELSTTIPETCTTALSQTATEDDIGSLTSIPLSGPHTGFPSTIIASPSSELSLPWIAPVSVHETGAQGSLMGAEYADDHVVPISPELMAYPSYEMSLDFALLASSHSCTSVPEVTSLSPASSWDDGMSWASCADRTPFTGAVQPNTQVVWIDAPVEVPAEVFASTSIQDTSLALPKSASAHTFVEVLHLSHLLSGVTLSSGFSSATSLSDFSSIMSIDLQETSSVLSTPLTSVIFPVALPATQALCTEAFRFETAFSFKQLFSQLKDTIGAVWKRFISRS